MAVAWLGQYHRTFRVTGPMDNASAGESGQRTALSTPNNAIFNGHPRDAVGEELSRRYYARELRSLSFTGRWPCCPEAMLSRSPHCCAVLADAFWCGAVVARLCWPLIVMPLPARSRAR
jgi:hypothetical protein